MKVCVDTSVWVAAFRKADSREAVRLAELLESDVVLMPAPVRLELLSGASRQDYPSLRSWLSALPRLEPSAGVWRMLDEWVARGIGVGERFGVADLLIAAIAAEEDASVWSLDSDFVRMGKLGFVKIHQPYLPTTSTR